MLCCCSWPSPEPAFPALTRIVLDSGQIRALMGIRFNGHLSICRRDGCWRQAPVDSVCRLWTLDRLYWRSLVSEQKDPIELTARLISYRSGRWLGGGLVAERRSAVPEQPVAELLHGLLHKKISAVLVRVPAWLSGIRHQLHGSRSEPGHNVKAWVLPVRGARLADAQ